MTANDSSDSEVEIISGPGPTSTESTRSRETDHMIQTYQREALKHAHIAIAEEKRIFCGICDKWVKIASPSDWWTSWMAHCCKLEHLDILNRLQFEHNASNLEEERRKRMERHGSVTSDVFPGIHDIIECKSL